MLRKGREGKALRRRESSDLQAVLELGHPEGQVQPLVAVFYRLAAHSGVCTESALVVAAEGEFRWSKLQAILGPTLVQSLLPDEGHPAQSRRLLWEAVLLAWKFLAAADGSNFVLVGDDMESLAGILSSCGVGEGQEVQHFLGGRRDDDLFAGGLPLEGRRLGAKHLSIFDMI